jgi:hypothetical protein
MGDSLCEEVDGGDPVPLEDREVDTIGNAGLAGRGKGRRIDGMDIVGRLCGNNGENAWLREASPTVPIAVPVAELLGV